MRHLFVDSASFASPTILIDGPDAHHLLHVLRVRAGESVVLLDNRGHAFYAEIIAADRRSLTVRLCSPAEVAPEPPVSIAVAQALGKGDRFEQVVQHATEIGASAFIPLQTERSVVRLDAREAESKRARWSLIAKGAAEQAGRALIPRVHAVATLPELAGRFGEYNAVIILHPGAMPLRQWKEARTQTITPSPLSGPADWAGQAPPLQGPRFACPFTPSALLLVGPEGGFTPAEVAAAQGAGAHVVSLGPYTLRTETAALVAVSQILFDVPTTQGDR